MKFFAPICKRMLVRQMEEVIWNQASKWLSGSLELIQYLTGATISTTLSLAPAPLQRRSFMLLASHSPASYGKHQSSLWPTVVMALLPNRISSRALHLLPNINFLWYLSANRTTLIRRPISPPFPRSYKICPFLLVLRIF